MKDYDPLTPEEVNEAAKEFFPYLTSCIVICQRTAQLKTQLR